MEPEEVRQEIEEAVNQAIEEQVGQVVDDELEANGFGAVEADAAIEAAREIVDEEDLTTFDFVEFRAEITDRGFSAAEAEAAWSELRDNDEIPDGGIEDAPRGGHPPAEEDEDEDEDQEEEAEEPERTPVDGAEEAPEEEIGRVIETEQGIPANLPPWAMEPWDLLVEPMGAGDDFAVNHPCEAGEDEVIWHFGGPDEVEALEEAGSVTGANTTGGGMFQTPFSRRPDSAAFNALAGADYSFDEGILVGLHVCMEDNVPATGGDWEQDNENKWFREGGYSTDQTIAFAVEKAHDVPDDVIELRNLINPLEQLEAGGNPNPGNPTTMEEDVPEGEPAETTEEGAEGDAVDYEHGQGIILTQAGCPSCKEFKAQESVQRALESGELVEVTPEDADWNTILDETDVEFTPGLVRYDAGEDTYEQVAAG